MVFFIFSVDQKKKPSSKPKKSTVNSLPDVVGSEVFLEAIHSISTLPGSLNIREPLEQETIIYDIKLTGLCIVDCFLILHKINKNDIYYKN